MVKIDKNVYAALLKFTARKDTRYSLGGIQVERVDGILS